MMAFDLLGAITPALRAHYLVEEQIGKGGMGMVCRAVVAGTGRRVALKVLWPELAQAVTGRRFLREIEILSRLTHPNLLPLLDSGLVEVLPGLEVPWLAMPYVEEDSLAARLTRTGKLDLPLALRIAREVAAGLGAVHASGYVHRDVKPSNILLGAGGVVLADFGLARAVAASSEEKVSTTGLLVGTPEYSSPEQSRGENIDGSSDLYSLGIVLYEMLAGERPFTGRNTQVVAAKHQHEPAPGIRIVRPEVPQAIEQTLLRLLAKRPSERPGSAEEVIESLLTL